MTRLTVTEFTVKFAYTPSDGGILKTVCPSQPKVKSFVVRVLCPLFNYFIMTAFPLLLFQESMESKGSASLIQVFQCPDKEERWLVWKEEKPLPGVQTEDDMTLEPCRGQNQNPENDTAPKEKIQQAKEVVRESPETPNDSGIVVDNAGDGLAEPFDFHSAIALTRDMKTLYACIALSDDAVACYKLLSNQWKYNRTLGDNYDKLFGLALSPDENYLVATVAFAYKLWDLRTDKLLHLKLPAGIRNIPNKNQLNGLVVFTKNSEFLVAGVRKNLYVWDVKAGNLLKTLDVHFGRIISLVAVSTSDTNKVISSSIDKSIKVWNFDNILEDVHSIDRLEKPIESVSLAANVYVGATTTRNCVGIWNLESGRLIKTLSNSAHSSIVTHSVLSADASILVSAESGNVLIWDVDRESVLKQDRQRDVQQLLLTDEDKKCIAISKAGLNQYTCVCRSIPEGEIVYQFEYNAKVFRNAVVTADGLFLVVSAIGSKKDAELLKLFHAKTGTHVYDMTPKYHNYKNFSQIIAMPNEPNHVALIDDEKGNIWDIKKKSFVRSVNRWNGVCSSNGKQGLYAPNRGGLELIELKNGKTVHTLIPKVAEGVFNVTTMFTKNDQHVIYYHSGHRTIRVFRVSDGKKIANYKAHAEIKDIASTQGGMSIVLGAVDGSLGVLSVADPEKTVNKEFLSTLPSRQVKEMESVGHDGKMANGSTKLGMALRVARVTARAKLAQKSRACVIS